MKDELIPNVVVDIRLSIPVGDIDETGFNNKLVGMLHRMADHFEITQPDKDHGIVDMGDVGFTSWDAHWERWDDDFQTAQRDGWLSVDLSAYPNGDPTVNHMFDAPVTGEEEQDRALSRLRRDRRHWENSQEVHKSNDKPVPDPDFIVTPPTSTPRDDDKARYLKGSVADAWKDINKISRLFYVKDKSIHPTKHPIDSAPPPRTPGELPPGLNQPVVYPDTGGLEGPGVLSVDHTGSAEVVATGTSRLVQDFLTQILSLKEMYLIERERNPYDWDMLERTQEFLFTMLDTCNTPVELDIFNILERQSFMEMRSKNTPEDQKKVIYPSAVSKMMRHAAPLDLFQFLPGAPGTRDHNDDTDN